MFLPSFLVIFILTVFIFGHTLVACLQFPVVMTLHDLFLSSTLFAGLIIDAVYFNHL